MTATKRALTSHTASISGLAFLLLWAVSLTSRATAQTAASPEATVVITNGAGFISALANDSVLSAVVLSSFSVTDSDFDAYPKAIERSTNLTISGNATAQTEWPVVGLGFVRGKVKLVGPAALIFERVVVRDFRATPLGQSPGFDLVATSDQDVGALVLLNDSVLMLRICVPRSIQGEIMSSISRPPSLPGVQTAISNVSQSGCLNDTNAPPVSRCWPDLGVYEDVAVAGFDIDAFGRASATRYNLYLLHVPYLCERQMTDDCVAALGPLGCYLYMFPRMPIATPPPASAPVPITPATGSSKVAWPAIVAGCVGGVVLLSAVAVVSFIVVRRKRAAEAEEQRKKQYEAEAKRMAKSTTGIQLAADNGQPPGGPGGAAAAAAVKGASSNGSAPVSTNGPPSGANGPGAGGASEKAGAAGAAVGKAPSSTKSNSLQHSMGRHAVLPNGVGTCVLSSADVDASSPLVIVTPFTPHRSDLKLDVQCDTEVQLLPIIRGKGSYGRVVEGLYNGQRVAVKLVVDVDEWSGPTESLINSFSQEVEVLGRCQHPNIVRLLAACLKPPRLCLVMELMDTSLERLVHGKQGELLPLMTVLHIAADIARGLAYLHPTIIHRDLKPGNVLLSHVDRIRPIAKLTDFGLSRLRSTVLVTRHPEAGTPAYMAPEAFDASNYVITHKADIYALGVILWEMLTGSVPWEGCSMVAIAYSITVRHHRLPLSKLDAARCPPKLRKLIHQCWDPDPQRRPAAAELVKQLTLVMQMIQGESEAASSASSSIRSGDATPGNNRANPQQQHQAGGSGARDNANNNVPRPPGAPGDGARAPANPSSGNSAGAGPSAAAGAGPVTPDGSAPSAAGPGTASAASAASGDKQEGSAAAAVPAAAPAAAAADKCPPPEPAAAVLSPEEPAATAAGERAPGAPDC